MSLKDINNNAVIAVPYQASLIFAVSSCISTVEDLLPYHTGTNPDRNRDDPAFPANAVML